MSERTPHQAYAALQRLAREQRRTSQQLFELYVHERFLARLAESSLSQRFVLKGGMLLAVLDVRCPTRDADLLVRGLATSRRRSKRSSKRSRGCRCLMGSSFIRPR